MLLVSQKLGILTSDKYLGLHHIVVSVGIVVVEQTERVLRPSLAIQLEPTTKMNKKLRIDK